MKATINIIPRLTDNVKEGRQDISEFDIWGLVAVTENRIIVSTVGDHHPVQPFHSDNVLWPLFRQLLDDFATAHPGMGKWLALTNDINNRTVHVANSRCAGTAAGLFFLELFEMGVTDIHSWNLHFDLEMVRGVCNREQLSFDKLLNAAQGSRVTITRPEQPHRHPIAKLFLDVVTDGPFKFHCDLYDVGFKRYAHQTHSMRLHDMIKTVMGYEYPGYINYLGEGAKGVEAFLKIQKEHPHFNMADELMAAVFAYELEEFPTLRAVTESSDV